MERLSLKVERALVQKNVLLTHLYGRDPITAADLLPKLMEWAERLRPYICDTTSLLLQAIEADEQVLLEGQLGTLRDPDHGIYPFSTSSSTLAGAASAGAGIPPHAISRITAVVKAYSSCVGAGPFVTELAGAQADELRSRGGDAGEFGATTGRPRRMGWFDGVASRYGCAVQGATEVALTNLDVLGYLDTIPVCTAYQVNGSTTDVFPAPARLQDAAAVYEELPGWKCDIRGVSRYEELPAEARQYVAYIERLVGKPVRWISTGPERSHYIQLF